MKILQVCYKYPPFFSGYGKQLATINKEIMEIGADLEVDVVTAYGKVRRRIYGNSIAIHAMFESEGSGLKYYYLFSLFSVFRYIRLFLRADIIHIVKAGPELIVPTVLAKLFRKKVIVKVAQDDLEGLLEPSPGMMRKLRRFFLRRADYVVALSGKIAEEAAALGIGMENIRRIPNGVDFGRFNYFEAEPRLNKQHARSFIFVGSISRRKGIEDLLRALELYNGSPILFSFYGPLFDIENFEQRLIKISERGHVIARYCGVIERPEVVMREHDCLVLPSYSEGMPNVVLEAMACGLYVILSNINVHGELCEMAEGSLFRVGDSEDLHNKIASFMRINIDENCKRAQSRSIEALASSTNVAHQYICLYRAARNGVLVNEGVA